MVLKSRQILITLMVVILAGAVSCSGGTSVPIVGGGAKTSPGLLRLVPDGYESVTRWDVAKLMQGQTLEDLGDDFLNQWEWLEEFGIFPDDLTELVAAEDDRGNSLLLFAGPLDFEGIRDDLHDTGFRDSTYRRVEVWDNRRNPWAVALLEEDKRLALSSPGDDGVKDVIQAMDRESGFLFQGEDSELAGVVGRVSSGFQTIVEEGCPGVDARGCEAVAYSARVGADGFTVELEWAFLFRRESSARSGVRDLEDHFDDAMPREVDVDELIQEGEYVLVRGLMEVDDYASPRRATTMAVFGLFYKGRILGVNVVAIDRMPELRYSVTGETETPTHLRIVPSEDSMELVVIRLKVENHTATSTIFTVDKEGIQLRDFISQQYFPIDVGERAEKVSNPPKRNSRSARVLALEPDGTFADTRGFIHGSVELKLHTGLDGWVIFEAPKDTKFRSFRWMAGDTVTIPLR